MESHHLASVISEMFSDNPDLKLTEMKLISKVQSGMQSTAVDFRIDEGRF